MATPAEPAGAAAMSAFAAGEAYAPDMTDASTRATWTTDGLRALFARLRVMYGDEAIDRAYYARVESDAPQGDPPAVVGETTDCPQCCAGPEFITGAEIIRGVRYYRLRCHHLVKA